MAFGTTGHAFSSHISAVSVLYWRVSCRVYSEVHCFHKRTKCYTSGVSSDTGWPSDNMVHHREFSFIKGQNEVMFMVHHRALLLFRVFPNKSIKTAYFNEISTAVINVCIIFRCLATSGRRPPPVACHRLPGVIANTATWRIIAHCRGFMCTPVSQSHFNEISIAITCTCLIFAV